ncbi:hypothetical protein HUJ04_008259 [Dendroctonus ponderosae]|nr:hypothetical protein HUJ04_008259 [Dendroctonus ponderosae]
MKRNEGLREKYVLFMNEYVELEHMRKLTEVNDCSMFLIREQSLTTNVGIVFDGYSKTTSGQSLNGIQYTGPAIQNDIFRILLRFRQHKFVVIADMA